MTCLQTTSFGWPFQDVRQLASKSAHPKQRVARSSPIFQISGIALTIIDKYFILGAHNGFRTCTSDPTMHKPNPNYL